MEGIILNKITDITKNEIIDILKNGFDHEYPVQKYDYYERPYDDYETEHIDIIITGKLSTINFLSRIYDLKELSSEDPRYNNALEDIIQHTRNNNDFDEFWYFDYLPFKIKSGNDDDFLRFIIEVFHPAVRKENSKWKLFLEKINKLLKHDGYQLYADKTISNRDVYSYRKISSDDHYLKEEVDKLSEDFNSEYINHQLENMLNSAKNNPSESIGKSKELLESCFKTILKTENIEYDKNWSINQLTKTTYEHLKLTPEDVEDSKRANDTIKKILGNLSAISSGIAELRNAYGTGHGKHSKFKGLTERHAKLAIGVSTVAARFIWETYREKNSKE